MQVLSELARKAAPLVEETSFLEIVTFPLHGERKGGSFERERTRVSEVGFVGETTQPRR